jgi:hypothetical protein
MDFDDNLFKAGDTVRWQVALSLSETTILIPDVPYITIWGRGKSEVVWQPYMP